MATVRDVQQRLISLGIPLPKFGADGDAGGETLAAINKALDELETLRGDSKPTPAPPVVGKSEAVVPADWMPSAKMDRIICHWTAGTHKATEFDRGHYHILIEADGNLVRGIPSIKLNEAPAKKGYAAHTLNCNTGSIGLSLCCMGGSVEAPFMPGKYPMTKAQWEKLTSVVADLCRKYSIKVTDRTVLSHAEVEHNLGIAQRGKWDFTVLAFDLSIKGARACGDKLRAEVLAKL
ncbi:N-acetylmuramoyl-L-alanine amidase [Agrobacterium salinitolerans]|uniref:peptidoglycan recognition protein family protein n=1 Tax=Agrobacterium salinitolerans TaxID=1183413 RepID=UPI0022B85137|nr:N-acetylmuramoyl-L-alanine amidase [Agrobacterium salinitolerans]MCZ7974345.1 N-acetylmuramoyl-L-alanine amidase [Agrobacterium salinitolerans]